MKRIAFHHLENATDPFIAQDGLGEPVLFFSMRTDADAPWKLFTMDASGDVSRIHTGMPDAWDETSPAAQFQGGAFHVSFISGEGRARVIYQMHMGVLDDAGDPVAVTPAHAGFALPAALVRADGESVVVERGGGMERIHMPRCEIHHIGYDHQAGSLLISGKDKVADRLFGIFLHPDHDAHEIVCDGKPGYRSAGFSSQHLYTTRKHHILEADTTEHVPTSLVAKGAAHGAASPCGSCGGCGGKGHAQGVHPVTPAEPTPAEVMTLRMDSATALSFTRRSCIECVEKHIGAAYVQMSEMRDGYANRLRIVGHLHEAEDESQAYPELHAAIRSARKSFQVGGVVPDWDGLALLIEREVLHA